MPPKFKFKIYIQYFKIHKTHTTETQVGLLSKYMPCLDTNKMRLKTNSDKRHLKNARCARKIFIKNVAFTMKQPSFKNDHLSLFITKSFQIYEQLSKTDFNSHLAFTTITKL